MHQKIETVAYVALNSDDGVIEMVFSASGRNCDITAKKGTISGAINKASKRYPRTLNNQGCIA